MRLDESEIQVVDPVSLDYNIIAAHDTFKNLEIRIFVYIPYILHNKLIAISRGVPHVHIAYDTDSAVTIL